MNDGLRKGTFAREVAGDLPQIAVSQLPPATEIKGDALIQVIQDNANFKALVSQLSAIVTVRGMRKTITIDSVATRAVAINLTEHNLYTKFHIEFPEARDLSDIDISITGLNNLIHPLESITMSGLDDGSTYLPSSKRGTITFTLDSTDYEFPSSIYHFGGFATSSGNIFLDIDFVEGKSTDAYKYMAENAIYADLDKDFCTIFDENTNIGQSTLVTYKDNTTIIFYHNGELLSSEMNIIGTNFRVNILNEFYGSSYYSLKTQIWFSNGLLPIMDNTGYIAKDNRVSIKSVDGDNVATLISSSDTATNLYISVEDLTYDLQNSSYWETVPTEYGLYRVIVKGTYAEKQLSL